MHPNFTLPNFSKSYTLSTSAPVTIHLPFARLSFDCSAEFFLPWQVSTKLASAVSAGQACLPLISKVLASGMQLPDSITEVKTGQELTVKYFKIPEKITDSVTGFAVCEEMCTSVNPGLSVEVMRSHLTQKLFSLIDGKADTEKQKIMIMVLKKIEDVLQTVRP